MQPKLPASDLSNEGHRCIVSGLKSGWFQGGWYRRLAATFTSRHLHEAAARVEREWDCPRFNSNRLHHTADDSRYLAIFLLTISQ